MYRVITLTIIVFPCLCNGCIVCMYVYLSVCLFVCLSVCLCLYVCLFVCMYVSVCMSVYVCLMSVCIPICLSSICPSVCMPVYLCLCSTCVYAYVCIMYIHALVLYRLSNRQSETADYWEILC